MLNISLLALTLCGDILVEPFRIADSEPGHHQVCVRAAMAPDGHFAIAWVDSLPFPERWRRELDLYIRFFDSTGNPLTDAYKIAKMVDTNWIKHPCLEMDTAGNVVLVCVEEDKARFDVLDNEYIRFQRFAPDGSPVGSAQTLVPQVRLGGWRPIGLSLANNDEFAIAWSAPSTLGTGAWVQRFNREGYPKNNAFLAHDDFGTSVYFYWPQVALSDAGDLVVTWVEFGSSPYQCSYPRFQVFDAQDESILPWEGMGHRLDDGAEVYSGTRAETFWLDDDRFVVFWIDKTSRAGILPHLVGRVFSDRGLTRHPLRWLMWGDSLWLSHGGPEGWYSTAVSPNDGFAYTHTRTHSECPDTSDPSNKRYWTQSAGILGEVVNNEPWRRTTLFEYTPPLGADIVSHMRGQPSAVACCDDRIVWVYSRFNTDTIFEAWAIISDWDMGVGVAEQPIVEKPPNWKVITSIGPQIVLRYQDRPDGFRASIFDACGRKVDEVHATESSGMITWGRCYGPGVYFIVPSGGKSSAQKVVLIK